MQFHLLTLFGGMGSGICIYASYSFYSSGNPNLETASFVLVGISTILMLLAGRGMRNIAIDNYQRGIEDTKFFFMKKIKEAQRDQGE